MGKKILYGDPRKVDYGDVDILDTDVVKSIMMDRKKLQQIYDGVQFKTPKEGSVINVKYLGTVADSIVFDGGFKDYVRMENRQNESKYLKNTNIGDSVDVYILAVNQGNFHIKGSIAEIYESRARKSLTSLEEGSSVQAFVRETTPAGYNMDIIYEGVTLPGFMPNTLAGINKLYDTEQIVGKTFNVMIESFSREEGTYIVSRRKYLQSLAPMAVKQLEFNKVYTGNVTGTADFGVFVEFYDYDNSGSCCLTGMIHKTNVDPDWAERLHQIQPGFEIEFYIKEIIKDKIILTQILRETLWDTIRIGQIMEAEVKDIKQFGALVILDSETNGLVHTSELEKSSKKLSQGDTVKVKVIAVDRSSRKIFLSVA